jgi:hypothetical protein
MAINAERVFEESQTSNHATQTLQCSGMGGAPGVNEKSVLGKFVENRIFSKIMGCSSGRGVEELQGVNKAGL